MFDVFYLGPKPNLFDHERYANSIEDAGRQCRTRYFWITSYLADYSDWDWLWEPPPWQSHQRHVWPSQWQRNSGTMLVPRAGYQDTNYHQDRVIRMLPSHDCWWVPDWIDPDSVDRSWHPDADEDPWTYHFASQHQRSSGVTYKSPGTLGIKFADNMIVRSREQEGNWHIPNWIRRDSLDFTWHPDSLQPPLIYHFATIQGWHNTGGPEYHVPNATRVCYSNDIVAETQSEPDLWHIPDWIDPDSVDRSWCPHPGDPPMIYEFPVEWGWNRVGGPQYRVPGAEAVKYVDAFVARTRRSEHMRVLDNLAEHDFVRRWQPCPADPPYIYVFGNQWWPAEKRASAEYRVTGATERKYMSAPRAQRLADRTNFTVLIDSDFDFSWEPDPGDPAYIYVFGNQWWSAEKMPTVEYHVPGATERKFMAEPRAQLRENPCDYWRPLEDCDWDSSWRPDPGDPAYIYVFGNQWWPAETWPTLEYRVPGATEHKYVNHPRAQLPSDDSHWWIPEGIDPDSVDRSWRPDPGSPPYIYEFGTQWQKTGGARYTVPGATEIKYSAAFRCRKTSHDPYWHMPADLANVIEDFDWTWHPDATEEAYVYEFGTQHQKTGGPEYHVPGAVQRKYVDQVRVEVRQSRARAIIIDHMDNNARAVHEQILTSVSVMKTVRYVSSYLDTLKRIAAQVDEEWIWIVSSVCDYQGFDFTWYPEQWQATMLHVFASDDLKFGDTFFMHVPTFRERAGRVRLLEWYDVNFVDQSVQRRTLPKISHSDDTHVTQISMMSSMAPLVVLSTSDIELDQITAVNLWRAETKAVTPLRKDNGVVILPRDCKNFVRTQVYDYPIIDKSRKHLLDCDPLDVVFISYDEREADDNWNNLLGRCPRAKRVHGVPGMENALLAAAKSSTTPWFYAVFGKTELAPDFGFDHYPDYFQQPKHYIFYSKIRANGLCYGEMGLIMYNRAMVIENHGREFGLDYTMSFPHEVVPVISTLGNFDTSPYQSWRTAFRETAKLAYFQHTSPSVENQYHLKIWRSHAVGPFAEWVLRGARDGYEFWQESQNDVDKLKKSFVWQWLRQRFVDCYGEID